ncbi:MAG: tRNA (adenosine(37)-N6)-threonylcarbamoyltransferase complex dimerization subunit type 1 TsaB [Chthoniobacterales bacterium]|nr:tRNA (adenosine(37)-N6)-threonylcarbamoyltransferase complex dimerization subunit type 1 TsaB [Chthoniobacterales bacterium]
MKILALELSTAVGSIAFRDGESASVVRRFPADRKHSGLFYENLSAIRSERGLPDTIVVGLGPGSYAGTRIAIATAIGLRAASNARLIGLPSICAIDLPEYFVIGDARRSSYFLAHVRAGICVTGPTLASEEELWSAMTQHQQIPFVASEPLPKFADVRLAHPSATLLATLAENAEVSDKTLEPIYLRQPYITAPKATPWTR